MCACVRVCFFRSLRGERVVLPIIAFVIDIQRARARVLGKMRNFLFPFFFLFLSEKSENAKKSRRRAERT